MAEGIAGGAADALLQFPLTERTPQRTLPRIRAIGGWTLPSVTSDQYQAAYADAVASEGAPKDDQETADLSSRVLDTLGLRTWTERKDFRQPFYYFLLNPRDQVRKRAFDASINRNPPPPPPEQTGDRRPVQVIRQPLPSTPPPAEMKVFTNIIGEEVDIENVPLPVHTLEQPLGEEEDEEVAVGSDEEL